MCLSNTGNNFEAVGSNTHQYYVLLQVSKKLETSVQSDTFISPNNSKPFMSLSKKITVLIFRKHCIKFIREHYAAVEHDWKWFRKMIFYIPCLFLFVS